MQSCKMQSLHSIELSGQLDVTLIFGEETRFAILIYFFLKSTLVRGTWPQLDWFSCSCALSTLKNCVQVLSDLEWGCDMVRRGLNITVSQIVCHFCFWHVSKSVLWTLTVSRTSILYPDHLDNFFIIVGTFRPKQEIFFRFEVCIVVSLSSLHQNLSSLTWTYHFSIVVTSSGIRDRDTLLLRSRIMWDSGSRHKGWRDCDERVGKGLPWQVGISTGSRALVTERGDSHASWTRLDAEV